MRLASLGSGSRGNATLITGGDTTVLIDCGFSLRETEARLARLGLAPAALDAILLTHEHADHVGGVGALARKYRLPVWLTAGTLKAATAALGELPRVCLFSSHAPFSVNGLLIEPIAVPHDAREPSQFILGDGRLRVGLLTDAGHATPYMHRVLGGLDALLLEFNHDDAMLAAGPYPEPLKKRIASPLGHLSNAQAGELLGAIDTGRLRYLAAMHLSVQNNTPALVQRAAATTLGCAEDWVAVADQEIGLPWHAVGSTW